MWVPVEMKKMLKFLDSFSIKTTSSSLLITLEYKWDFAFDQSHSISSSKQRKYKNMCKRALQYPQVETPPPQPFLQSLKNTLNEILFADDPFRKIRNESKTSKKIELVLRHVFPILEWARGYNLNYLKSDVISGITIASLAIPQGISYAQLANLPPILGLCTFFLLSFYFILQRRVS